MALPVKTELEYFLAIEGEQKGPFSWEQVSQMLSEGAANDETPVWYAGMADWTTLANLDHFTKSNTGEDGASFTEPETAMAPQQQINSPVKQVFESKAPISSSRECETVFSLNSHFEPVEDGANKKKLYFTVGGLCLLIVGYYFWTQSQANNTVSVSTSRENLKQEKKVSNRKTELSLLNQEFYKNQNETLPKLIQFIKTNAKDNEGLEALTVVLDYYKQKQLNLEAGELLLTAERPKEAVEYFLKEPPNYQGLDSAYEMVVKTAVGEERKNFLLKQIDLQIKNLGNTDLAKEKIKLLEKEFPGVQHPYQFYFKSTEEKIADLFSKVSFRFSESLKKFTQDELNSISFEKKPLIQIIKERSGNFRIVATYKGNINLRNDRLKNIYFVFWMAKDQWIIADTNITKERTKFAQENQKKYADDIYTATTLYVYLENLFKANYPGKSLHESVSLPKTSQNLQDE